MNPYRKRINAFPLIKAEPPIADFLSDKKVDFFI